MKSVSAKIIAWSIVALLVSLAAFWMVSQRIVGTTLMTAMDRYNNLTFHQARAAYESGGPAALSQYLHDLRRYVAAETHLTDAHGKDLETGRDLSALLPTGNGPFRTTPGGGAVAIPAVSAGGRYYWLMVVKPPFSPLIFTPFYLIVFGTVGALYWLVRARIAVPLHRLADVVERFGRGDLNARAGGDRRDEIGNLGRSFDEMAARIQTLLSAERQLLQDVSHELRSPLARLTFEAEMVRKTTDPDASASRLRHEVERLSSLVGTLLDMARIEADPGTAESEDVDIEALAQRIVEDCTVEASARKCGISFSPTGDLHVWGNEELLHRALENVVRNAIRYAPESSGVEVHARRDSNRIAISVRDYGPGIPDELIQRVFDPFFKVDSSRGESAGGVGLGLAIARRALRVHGGDLTARNAHPGAEFTLTIPVGSEAGA
jgi:signal transduction histidine kinase